MKKFRRKVLDMLMSNNSGSNLRQQLFDGAPFCSELLHTAIPQRAASGTTGTFTRATTATVEDHEGVLRTAIAGEARFEGARRVRNWIQAPTENWSSAGWGKSGISVSGNRLTATGANGVIYDNAAIGMGTGRTAVGSVTLSRVTGTGNIDVSINGGTTWTTVSVTGARVSVSLTGNINGQFAIRIVTSGDSVDATYPQLEDVTAQTTQTAGEYVSVGVESAPYYHGSMVDGVKCFPTDLSGNPLPTEYTYDAVSLNGVAGTYVSTPDSVAASITGDIDIRVKAALTDWTPAAVSALVAKDDAVASRCFVFYVNTSGQLEFTFSVDGLVYSRLATSSAAVGADNGASTYVRMTYAAATGKVNFYTAADGISWALLGTEQTVAAGGIFDGTAVVEVGSYASGASGLTSGKIYRAQIYNGIDGTLAVDFDASRYAGGTTLTGSTGETWTLQGNAVIHPTNNPMLGYLAEGARTNLCLQSQDFATTWTVTDATISVNTKVAADGTTTADSLVENAAAATAHVVTQAITKAASSAAYTLSVYVEKGGRDWVALTLYDNTALGARAWFNVNTGVVGSTANIGAGMGTITANIESVGGGIYRCKMSVSASGTATRIDPYIYSTNADAVLSVNGINAVGLYLWGAQLELGSSASSYIATTTVAVTRNADVLTYSGGDIPNLKTVAHTSKSSNITVISGILVSLDDGTVNNYMCTFFRGAAGSEELRYEGYASAAHQWIQGATYTLGSTTKAAFSVATNDIKMSKDGVGQTPDTVAAVPTASKLSVGHLAGAFQLSGNVGGIYGWTRNFSQSELNAVTA